MPLLFTHVYFGGAYYRARTVKLRAEAVDLLGDALPENKGNALYRRGGNGLMRFDYDFCGDIPKAISEPSQWAHMRNGPIYFARSMNYRKKGAQCAELCAVDAIGWFGCVSVSEGSTRRLFPMRK